MASLMNRDLMCGVVLVTLGGALLILALGGCPQSSGGGSVASDFTTWDPNTAGSDTDGQGGTSTSDSTSAGSSGGSGGGSISLDVMKTSIAVQYDAGLACSDNLVVFGTGVGSDDSVGVRYVAPTTNPGDATAVPNTALYDAHDFAVSGRTVFLAGSASGGLAYRVSVFDSQSGTILTTFESTEITLEQIASSMTDPARLRADGDYCVVICDQSKVTDGKIIKVIDVSGTTPTVTALEHNPVGFAHLIDQAVVDAETKKVVVAGDQVLFIYDLDDPTKAPTYVNVSQGIGSAPLRIEDGMLIATDGQQKPELILLDLESTKRTEVPGGVVGGGGGAGW